MIFGNCSTNSHAKRYRKGQRLYSYLANIGKTFVTTNYDEWLDEQFSYGPADLTEATSIAPPATPRTVYHRPEELTVSNLNQENYVLTFLAHLFTHKTVLFVGYGLEELEILEYVILKARTTRGMERRHFLLQGFFSHERELMVSLGIYYHECGIHLIPFLKDQEGWDQLLHVLESFGQSVPASSSVVLQEFKKIEAHLDG